MVHVQLNSLPGPSLRLSGARPDRSLVRVKFKVEQRRRELLWAWLSLAALVVCWDAAARLDEKVSPTRPRLTHMAESEAAATQNALMPVSARPTVN
jgi:hypothetical protein